MRLVQQMSHNTAGFQHTICLSVQVWPFLFFYPNVLKSSLSFFFPRHGRESKISTRSVSPSFTADVIQNKGPLQRRLNLTHEIECFTNPWNWICEKILPSASPYLVRGNSSPKPWRHFLCIGSRPQLVCELSCRGGIAFHSILEALHRSLKPN